MKTISIINQKGGVGKSTTALALGAYLSKGSRVLLVDLDPQGNLTYTLNAETAGYNAMGALQRPQSIKGELQASYLDNTAILASSTTLTGADTVISDTGKEYRLKEALNHVRDQFDYCIIDTPPALGVLIVNALTASEGLIIPVQADIYSLQGISQLRETVEAVRKYCNPTLDILGILLTRYNGRAVLSQKIVDLLEQTAEELDTKVFKTRIRECVALKEAQAMKSDIYSYAPKSNASKDYRAFVEEFLEEV